jgi:hypothetical protein
MRLRSEEERKQASFNWILWLKWILVSTLGWALGLALGIEFVVGAVVGLLQWVVLRPLIRGGGWWVPASAAGWAGGAALVTLVLRPQSPVLGPVVIGLGMGVAQWLVLRWQVYRAWWWIVLSTLGWALGMMGILGAPLAGAVAGAVTGFGLELLLRHRRMGTSDDVATPGSEKSTRRSKASEPSDEM